MNAAQNGECSADWKNNVGLAAWLLVARIEAEFIGVDVRMMEKISVVINDLDCLAEVMTRLPGWKARPRCDTR
jgi:hypothetical protein